MILGLDSRTYHRDLRPDERELVDLWLGAVLDDYKAERITRYEVIGEGVVLFERVDREPLVLHTALAPPVMR